MKTNELMIGDWVRTEAGALIVAGVGHKIYCRANDGNPTHLWEVTSIEPIPLTPEILEKNGWGHKYYDIYRQTIGETITIDIFPEGCSVVDDRGNRCFYRLRYQLPALKFVHELQHALRLCGIDKEIEL